MKTNELKELGAEELEAKIAEVRKELDDLKLKLASKVDVEKPVRIRLERNLGTINAGVFLRRLVVLSAGDLYTSARYNRNSDVADGSEDSSNRSILTDINTTREVPVIISVGPLVEYVSFCRNCLHVEVIILEGRGVHAIDFRLGVVQFDLTTRSSRKGDVIYRNRLEERDKRYRLLHDERAAPLRISVRPADKTIALFVHNSQVDDKSGRIIARRVIRQEATGSRRDRYMVRRRGEVVERAHRFFRERSIFTRCILDSRRETKNIPTVHFCRY